MSTVKNEKIYTCSPEDIVVPEERQRKSFNPQKIQDLADSFSQYGQFQPGVCRKEGDKIILIAGERRLRAAKKAGIPYRYIFTKDVKDTNFYLEIELEENLCREDLSWQEGVDALQKLHELYQAREGKTRPGARGGQTIEATARVLGGSKTALRDDLELASFLEIEEVRNASTKTEAKKVVKRFKEQIIRDVALDKAVEGKTISGGFSFESSLTQGGNEPTKKDIEDQLKARLDYFDERCVCGDFTKLLGECSDNFFDLVFFDPPWGVDFDKVKKPSASKKEYKDKTEDFSKDFPKWIELIYKKMAENSILYLFFGIANIGYIYDMLEKTGFTVDRIPIIWHKRGAHSTRNPKVWPGRCYEPIAYCRKGSKDLQLLGAPDIITTPMPNPKLKSIHPSAKHPDIYRELLKRSAFPGDNIVDPMCGSGMLGVAADSLLDTIPTEWKMFELDEDYRTLAMTNLMKGYTTLTYITSPTPGKTIVNSKEILLESKKLKWVDTTFRDLEPAGNAWMEYWNDFPDQQEAMLKWQQKT